MQQGNKKRSGLEFYDWNYDGEQGTAAGGVTFLKKGLGSLTDSNCGPTDFKLTSYAKSNYD